MNRYTTEIIAEELYSITMHTIGVYVKMFEGRPLNKMAIAFLHTGYTTALMKHSGLPSDICEKAIELCNQRMEKEIPEYGNSIKSPIQPEKLEEESPTSPCCGEPIVNGNCMECKENV